MKSPNSSLITVIIPCYHAGKYMKGLLADLQSQTFTQFDVIMVNDGDPKQVSEMEEVARLDNRISIIHKENGGAPSARNAAIPLVNTEWVVFADADDRFAPDYLLNLYNAVEGTNAELAVGGYTTYQVKTGVSHDYIIDVPEKSKNVMALKDAYEKLLPWSFCAYPWNKIYKMSVIRDNGLQFNPEIIVMDDYVFNLDYLSHVNNVSLFPLTGYIFYQADEASMMSSYSPTWNRDYRILTNKRDSLRRRLEWPEERIEKEHQMYLAYLGYKLCTNPFLKKSPLTLRQAAERIHSEVLKQPDVKAAVLQFDPGSDKVKRLHRFLVRLDNAWLIAITFKVMISLRQQFAATYAKSKKVLRGE